MSDPAIKVALEAAVVAYDKARVALHRGDYARDRMSAANAATMQPLIAAALSALLGRLGTDAETGRVHSPATGWIGLRDLAAAVEEAARDG